MAVTNGYASVDLVQGDIQDQGGTIATVDIEVAIEAASREIEEQAGRVFWLAPSTSTRTYRPRTADTLYIDDIGSLTGLVVESDPTSSGTWTTWAATDVEPEPRNASGARSWTRLRAVGANAFPTSGLRGTVRVTARWGWSAVPVQIQQACRLRTAALLGRRSTALGIAGYDGFGPIRISRFGDPDIERLIAPFIRATPVDD